MDQAEEKTTNAHNGSKSKFTLRSYLPRNIAKPPVRHRKFTAWTISLLLAISMLALVGNQQTKPTLNQKELAFKNSLSEANNLLNSVQLTDIIVGSDQNTTIKLIALESAVSALESHSFDNSKGFECLFQFKRCQKLSNDIQASQIATTNATAEVKTVLANLKATEKFLKYNLAEDFAYYGQNQQNDVERLTRTIEGIQAMSATSELSKAEIINQLNETAAYLKVSRKSLDVKQAHKTLVDAQQKIVSLLATSLQSVQTSYSQHYSAVLYQ